MLVTRQSTGAVTTGGSWAGVGVVQHQVHNVEGAGAEMEEKEAVSSDSSIEQEEEWELQAGWGMGQPEEGDRCWRMVRRMHLWRWGRSKLAS